MQDAAQSVLPADDGGGGTSRRHAHAAAAPAPHPDESTATLDFLAGGGEMGARMRTLDWARTPLGPAHTWPQSLRSPLSMLLPSKAQIILFWGPEFIVFYNDAYRPVFGAKHPHMLGRPGSEAWSEIWESKLRELLVGVVRTGEAFWAKDLLFLLERYGFVEETYFDVSYDPVRDESGRVGGVFCIVTETTARVVGERRLALLKDLAAHNATARTPREACVLAMETLATRPDDIPFAYACSGDELQAETPGARAAREAASAEQVKEIAIPGTAVASPFKLIVGINPKRPFDAQYQSFLDLVAGQLSTAIANAQAYEDERKRAEALAELDRAKTAFFSNVSHEFRTPLTLMLDPVAELLSRAPPENRELLATIQRNGQRLLKLVNTLLDFARIEAGRVQACYEPTDLSALTADLASNFRTACTTAGISLEVDCPPLGIDAWVDREMWEKIVLNLLSNAFKFTLEGRISVRTSAAGDFLRLTVSDTGIGVAEESIGLIFERFHRVVDAYGRSHEGSGIGLALVHELVKLHGGRISVSSTPGIGTTFSVDIPAGNDHLPTECLAIRKRGGRPRTEADPYVVEALSWLPREAAHHGAPAAHARRILVADDNADLRDYVRRLLAEDYAVETVGDGVAALAAIRARRPDLIVSDVMMPRLDGFGLIRALREDPQLNTIPVIMLSARAGEEARVEGLERGVDDYLVKPFTAKELRARVAALLQSDDTRRRALEALRQSGAQVKALLDHAPLGAFLVDADLRIREVNPVALPVFGEISGGVRGRGLDEIMRIIWEPDYASEIVGLFRHTLETGEPYVSAERAQRRRDRGQVEIYDWRIDRIPLPDGRNGVVCYFRDVGAQVAARRAIEESREALREADRRKDEFLATLSHELRNPLAPLANALHAMRLKGDDIGSIGPLREIMERQLRHLVRLVDDLLEMSRITRGTFELRRERVQLATVLRNAVETSEPLVRAGNHQLHVRLAEEKLWLEGDPVRLAQIFSNLLNNASKYTDDGGSITLAAARDGDAARVSVRDNGCGIAPDALSRIFEMFSRENPTGARSQGGLGIGLTLARRLAQMHGGTIEARSDGLGRGSEFIVRLPLAAGAPAQTAAPKAADALSPLRILVVDDNHDAATSLAMVLRMLGSDVRIAYDGRAAIEAFGSCDPAVVLLDIGMPGMDGYEVARTLRARYPERRPAIVAMTGWGQEQDRRKAMEAGIDHHLTKPAEMESLQALLAGIAEQRAAGHTADQAIR